MGGLEEKPTKIVSLKEVRQMTMETARKIREMGFKPDIIVGLARGGWIPARLICDFLLVSDLVSLSVTHWGLPAEIGQEEAQLEHPFEIDLKGKKVLIVDDITDTGESLELAYDVVTQKDPAEVKSATMQYITSSKVEPDFYSERVEEWYWFLYPWCWTEDMTGFVETILKSQIDRAWDLPTIKKTLKKYRDIEVSTNELQKICQVLVDQERAEKVDGNKWKFREGKK